MARQDKWVPLGASYQWELPDPGVLLALEHAVWRLVEVREVPQVDWTPQQWEKWVAVERIPYVLVVRPVDAPDANQDRHMSLRVWKTPNNKLTIEPKLYVYPSEHYPVCVVCGEPMPCQEESQRVATEHAVGRAVERVRRFETPGVCPHCEKPVTERQTKVTFQENVYVPLGPPVTFHWHLKDNCRTGACLYEREWIQADPENRHAVLETD